MTTYSFLVSIISSSLVATIVSSMISFYSKKIDFKNEYFKLVIKKRLEAYEKLEFIVAILKTSALDEKDQKAYHNPFFNADHWQEFSAHLALSNSYSLWLDGIINEKLTELTQLTNQIRFEFDLVDQEELMKAGKKYYHSIASLRVELENLARKDILTLYSFKSINKKKEEDELQVIRIRRERTGL